MDAQHRYGEGEGEGEEATIIIMPMSHDGVLAPDQPDPACFCAPYQADNQPISELSESAVCQKEREGEREREDEEGYRRGGMSIDAFQEFQTFKELLSEAKATKEDVTTDLVEDIYFFCVTMVQPEYV